MFPYSSFNYLAKYNSKTQAASSPAKIVVDFVSVCSSAYWKCAHLWLGIFMTLRDWHVRNGMQTYMHLLQALVPNTNFVLYSSEIENDPIVPFHTSNLTMLSGERLCNLVIRLATNAKKTNLKLDQKAVLIRNRSRMEYNFNSYLIVHSVREIGFVGIYLTISHPYECKDSVRYILYIFIIS